MTRRTKRKLLSLALSLIILGVTMYLNQHPAALPQKVATLVPSGSYAIDHFVDGDTIAVKMDGHVEEVRMIGVDTPETHKPNTPVQCYGPEAAAYTKSLIGANAVRLEADPTNSNRDRYNRLLRYVYLSDNRLIEAELIKNGYGFAYLSFPFTKADEFRADEQQAETSRVGLWASCTVHTISGDRKQTNDAP